MFSFHVSHITKVPLDPYTLTFQPVEEIQLLNIHAKSFGSSLPVRGQQASRVTGQMRGVILKVEGINGWVPSADIGMQVRYT